MKKNFSNTTLFSETFAPGLHLKDCTIANAVFADCDFQHTIWQNVNLQNVQFHNCRFNKNTWQSGEISGCTLVGCEFNKHVWESVNVVQTLIDSAQLKESSWSGALQQVRLLRSTWSDVKLSWSTVAESQFYQMACMDKNFPWEAMQNTVFDACDLGELTLFQKKLSQLIFSRCQFALLDLTEAQLQNVDFIESHIEKMLASKLQSEYLQMGRVVIDEGNFTNVEISGGSVFTEATLTQCGFNEAKLGMAVFEKADIADCNFKNAEFLACNLADAHLERVSFKDAKLSTQSRNLTH